MLPGGGGGVSKRVFVPDRLAFYVDRAGADIWAWLHTTFRCRTFVSESGWQAGERGAVSEAFITDEASRKPLTAVEQFLFWLVLLYVKGKFSLGAPQA